MTNDHRNLVLLGGLTGPDAFDRRRSPDSGGSDPKPNRSRGLALSNRGRFQPARPEWSHSSRSTWPASISSPAAIEVLRDAPVWVRRSADRYLAGARGTSTTSPRDQARHPSGLSRNGIAQSKSFAASSEGKRP